MLTNTEHQNRSHLKLQPGVEGTVASVLKVLVTATSNKSAHGLASVRATFQSQRGGVLSLDPSSHEEARKACWKRLH